MTVSISARGGAAAVAAGLLLGVVPAVALAGPADATAAATKISIHSSKRVYVAGQRIRLGVHLNVANAPITYYQTLRGGNARVIYRTRTNRYGNSVIAGPARSSARYTVRYAGSAAHHAASDAIYLPVRVRLHLRVAGYYATSAGYHLYHASKRLFSTVVTAPNKAGHYVRFRAQKKINGVWRYLQAKTFRIGRKGTATITFRGFAGGRYRIRAEYGGDLRNASNHTLFTYARFTR